MQNSFYSSVTQKNGIMGFCPKYMRGETMKTKENLMSAFAGESQAKDRNFVFVHLDIKKR